MIASSILCLSSQEALKMSNNIDDYPNVLVVPDNFETPEQMIDEYMEILEETKGDKEFLRECLQMFFDDVNFWSARQMLIDQAKISIKHLQEMNDCLFDDGLDD